ncbi:MAG: homogentisate 1,2-dioxygenase [Actinomycetota bacterium]|nr:homogentisate 1,2-dioxygenase [Acidobacteriota bacterium]MDQ3592409.1 homogentisate 1,2-dioxygenase [Actinomycetota bacterium]
MPIYHTLGQMPRKRHIVFRQGNGALYAEELIGNKGFVGPSSLLYHIQQPTQIRATRTLRALAWKEETDREFRHRHFRTARLGTTSSITADRIPLLFNDDVAMSFVAPTGEDDFYYRNAQGDEVVYVSDGSGTLETQLGQIPFDRGDYLVIPRGILHHYIFASPVRCLVIESRGYVRTPKRYRNEHGQLTESAPFSERDIRRPVNQLARDERGEFRIVVKKDARLTEFVLDHHPFDVVGWDGYYYPWAFNIADFEPRVGRVHLPPPTHQTFEGDNFVICSFCPRPYDFDPQAVPVPYNHSNVMSDEVLYYASSEFMSRKGIEYGSVTLHPDGVPHGPHPGRTEASLGQKETTELAVMLDTFHPLRVSTQALDVEDRDYYRSWIE